MKPFLLVWLSWQRCKISNKNYIIQELLCMRITSVIIKANLKWRNALIGGTVAFPPTLASKSSLGWGLRLGSCLQERLVIASHTCVCMPTEQPICYSLGSHRRVCDTRENLPRFPWWGGGGGKETGAWFKLKDHDTGWGGNSGIKFHSLYLERKWCKNWCSKWKTTLQPHEENHPKGSVCQKNVTFKKEAPGYTVGE